MNDFTKEELLIMLLDIEAMNSDPKQKIQVIINKLKSMIDNYCEHEESEANYDYEVSKCKKCGVLFV